MAAAVFAVVVVAAKAVQAGVVKDLSMRAWLGFENGRACETLLLCVRQPGASGSATGEREREQRPRTWTAPPPPSAPAVRGSCGRPASSPAPTPPSPSHLERARAPSRARRVRQLRQRRVVVVPLLLQRRHAHAQAVHAAQARHLGRRPHVRHLQDNRDGDQGRQQRNGALAAQRRPSHGQAARSRQPPGAKRAPFLFPSFLPSIP